VQGHKQVEAEVERSFHLQMEKIVGHIDRNRGEKRRREGQSFTHFCDHKHLGRQSWRRRVPLHPSRPRHLLGDPSS
jgi:hypothetical protein